MVGRKPEDWRILTPIFCVLSPIVVGALAFLIARMIHQFDQRFDTIMSKIDVSQGEHAKMVTDYRDWREDVEKRLAFLRVGCCSEQSREVFK